MTIKKRLLTLMIFLLTSMSMMAQLSIMISDANGDKGQVIEVEVSVLGFNEITSMQFSVNWDSSILSLMAVENLTEALPDFTDNEIGLVNISAGALRVLWFDGSTQGVSIPDSSKLFTLKFEIIGEEEINSKITISDSPLPIEFTDSNSSLVDLSEVIEGKVVINTPDNITSLTELEAPNGMILHQNLPNPFKSTTIIRTNFPSVETVQLFITDVSGKVVYQNTFKTVQGENNIEIGRNLLRIPGTYYYTLQSEQYRLSRKLILLP